MRYLILLVLVLVVHSVFGQKNWIGGTGNWNDDANWDTFGIPGPDDFVTIDSGEVTIEAATLAQAKGVSIGREARVNLIGELSVVTPGSGGVSVSGIFQNAGGKLVVRNTAIFDGISISIYGVFINNGDVEVTNASSALLRNRNIFSNTANGNVILANNAVAWGLINSDTLINGGNIEISGTASDGILNSGNQIDSTFAFLLNSGTLTIDTAIGQHALDLSFLSKVQNTGTMNIRNSGVGFSGISILTNASTFLNTGELNIDTDLRGDGIEIINIITDSNFVGTNFLNTSTGVVNISDTNCNGCGGSGVDNQGTFTNQGQMNILPDNSFITLNGIENRLKGVFDNQGSITLGGSNFTQFVNYDGASFTNSGTIELLPNNVGFGAFINALGATFINNGTLINNNDRAAIQNESESIFINNDSIYSFRGLLNEAQFTNNQNAVLQIDSGYVTNANPFGDDEAPIAEFLNQGTVRAQNGFYGIENRDLAFFTNEGSLEIKNVASHGINNSSFFNDSDTTLFTNSGSILIDSTGRAGLYNFSGADFLNSGTIVILDAGMEGIYNSFGASNVFTNSGTINVSLIGTHGIYNVAPFDNTGTIRLSAFGENGIQCFNDTLVNRGTILVNTSESTVAGIKLRNPAHFINETGASIEVQDIEGDVVELDGGTFLNDGRMTFGPNIGGDAIISPDGLYNNLDSGELFGNGNIDGPVFSNQGFFKPGFSGPGIFSISGSYDHSQATFEYEIAGTAGPGVPAGSDLIEVTDTSTLGGILDIRLIDDFEPAVGDTFLVMTCGGACLNRFDFVSYPSSILLWDVIYDPNEVLLVYKGEPLTLDVGPDTTVCPGEIVDLLAVATGGDGNYSFLWDNGLGQGPIQAPAPTATTSYIVTVTDGINQTAHDTITILVRDLQEVTVRGELDICPGGTTTLDAGSFSAYSWSTGATTQTIDVNVPGAYFVSVIGANGCPGFDTVTITQLDNPVPVISGDPAFCQGEFTRLQVDSFASYQWSSGAITQSIQADAAGIFAVTVVDSNGCEGEAEITVIERSLPAPEILGSLILCPDSDAQLDAGVFESYLWSSGDTSQSIQISTPGLYTLEVSDEFGCRGATEATVIEQDELMPVINGDSVLCGNESTQLDAGTFISYLWDTGDTTQTLSVNAPGIYTVAVADENGCLGLAEIEVRQFALPIPEIAGVTQICPGDSTFLDAGTFDLYNWSTGSANQTITINAPGEYRVRVTDANGCTGQDSIIVEGLEVPIPEIQGPAALCTGEPATLTVGNFNSYLWSTTETSASIDVNAGGVYSVEVTNDAGCRGVASLELTENEAPQAFVSASRESICFGETARLFADGIGTFSWSDPDQQIQVVSSTADEATLSPLGTTTVTLIAANECGADSATITITVNTAPVIRAFAAPDTIIAGASTRLTASGASSYTWTGPSLSCSNCADPTASPTSTSVYTLEGTDQNGCTATTEIQVFVLDAENLCNIPEINVITPNGDGVNDRLSFDGVNGLDESKLTVFNRWGSTVYESLDYQNDWDGTYDGQDLPAGTYMYVLSLRAGQSRCSVSNTVTIIR